MQNLNLNNSGAGRYGKSTAEIKSKLKKVTVVKLGSNWETCEGTEGKGGRDNSEGT